MDLEWLQYIGNPYSVIALIAAMLGISFRTILSTLKKPSPNLILATYGLFLLTVISLALSVIAISFLSSGRGATDELDVAPPISLQLIPVASAHNPNAVYGWIWAGNIVKWSDEDKPMEIHSYTVTTTKVPHVADIVFTGEYGAHLRNLPPKFSWWLFQYVLGTKIDKLPPNEPLEVIRVRDVGGELWLQVQVLHEQI